MYHGSCTNLTGSYTGFSQEYMTFLRQWVFFFSFYFCSWPKRNWTLFFFFLSSSRYWEVQVDIGESIQGWVFWTWKVSFCPIYRTARALFSKIRGHTTKISLFISSDVLLLVTDHWPFAILRLKTQTNGATKRVWRAVGFQVTPPIDYTLGYVLKKNTHTQACICLCPIRWTTQLCIITEEGIQYCIKIEVRIRRLNPGARTKINRIGTIRFDFITSLYMTIDTTTFTDIPKQGRG